MPHEQLTQACMCPTYLWSPLSLLLGLLLLLLVSDCCYFVIFIILSSLVLHLQLAFWLLIQHTNNDKELN
jgi:hypothetical protein